LTDQASLPEELTSPKDGDDRLLSLLGCDDKLGCQACSHAGTFSCKPCRRHARSWRSVDVVNLPDIGIAGNSHRPMMDKNNGAFADFIQ
jgi:hypothetical protein